MAINKKENQPVSPPPPDTPKQQSLDTPEGKYREALLNAATKAANLLGELMELSLIGSIPFWTKHDLK